MEPSLTRTSTSTLPPRFDPKLYRSTERRPSGPRLASVAHQYTLRTYSRTISSANGSGTSISLGHATRPHPHWNDSWEKGGWSHGVGGWNGWLPGSKQQDMYCRRWELDSAVLLHATYIWAYKGSLLISRCPLDVPITTAPLSPVKTDVTMCYVKGNCEPRSSGHEEAYGRNVVKPSSATLRSNSSRG